MIYLIRKGKCNGGKCVTNVGHIEKDKGIDVGNSESKDAMNSLMNYQQFINLLEDFDDGMWDETQ